MPKQKDFLKVYLKYTRLKRNFISFSHCYEQQRFLQLRGIITFLRSLTFFYSPSIFNATFIKPIDTLDNDEHHN